MHVVESSEKHRLEWLDEGKTILRIVAEPGWTWDDAYVAIRALDREIASVPHNVYSIYQFQEGAGVLPKHSAPNLKRLLGSELSNEKIIILVGMDGYLNTILSLLQRIYGYLASNASKIQIVHNMDEALTVIEADKKLTKPDA